MIAPEKFISTARVYMAAGEVDDAAELLTCLWWVLDTADGANAVVVDRLDRVTGELADRFPLAESVSKMCYHATCAYVVGGDLISATRTASRMVAVWRARAQEDPSGEAMIGHLHALDTLAGVFRARGRVNDIKACLVELVEWHLDHGTPVSVAWGVRELGALALLGGELENAAAKFTRADELYGEDPEEAADPGVAAERAECRVLLGRVCSAQGRNDLARDWFEAALDALPEGDEAREVRGLLEAARLGVELPQPELLRIGEFGHPDFRKPDLPPLVSLEAVHA